MIRVVNLKNYKAKPNEILVKVDRTTPVGNPFFMKGESQRNEVCDKYEKWFAKQLELDDNFKFKEYLKNIIIKAQTNDIALGCWCYPKRCHAETIKRFVEDALNK